MRVRLEVRRAPWRRRTQRSDGLWKGRRGGIGYAARDMARQVKWEDPALRREREREKEKERTRASGRRACEKERARTRGEKTREREREKRERERGHACEKERESARERESEDEQERDREKGGEGESSRHNNDSNGGFVTTAAAMGDSWAWTGAPAPHRRPGEDRRCGCTCSTVVRRGTARESSYHRRHCSPKHRTGGWRRAVGCGSSRQDFPPLAPAYGCISRRWRHFFSEYLNRQLLRP